MRTRLRLSAVDEAVLGEVGAHLGSLAGKDLAARCREGRMDARQRAESRRERKRGLTSDSSSRWAGAITRTSEDQYRRAEQNLWAERTSLLARICRIEARLAVAAAGCEGRGRRRVRGYATTAERHCKTVRRQTLHNRLEQVEARLQTGRVSVVRGGKAVLHKRNNLDAAGVAEAQWRQQWEAARLFLTADGEKDKAWGNETIRWHPEQQWLEIKLPAPLTHLANRPHGRYRLSCPVSFSYQREQVAAQAATGAVRYDISFDPTSGRWHLHASWKRVPTAPPSLDELHCHPVVSVDVNDAHLDVAALAPDGNLLGTPVTFELPLAGLPATARDGRLRAVISRILETAAAHDAKAVVIEDLDFADARQQGREHSGNRPARGRRGRRYRGMVAGIPTAQLRDRLTQMAYNAGIAVIVVDPAYTSQWGTQHWLAHLKRHHHCTGHHAAALVIGRRGLGHRARRRVTGNQTAPAEAARSTQTRPRTTPSARTAPRKPATPTGHRQPRGIKTGRPRQTPAGDQATQDRSGTPHTQDPLLLCQ
ncbi:MAG TPA: hypothetical protein VFQ37_16465 [Mycobacterium sp.]|nr:hypothetical protein [Mycobacterium sp.]